MIQVIGWTGALLYIASYALLSTKKLKPGQITYQLLNVLGGVCLVINSLHQSDYPSVFTNAVWALIGVLAILFYRK
jgi:hypothetical protein